MYFLVPSKARLPHTCMNANIHNIMFPLFLRHSSPNSFPQSQVTTKIPKNITAFFIL